MPLFKITNCSRERRFCVVAETVGKLLEKAKQKFAADDLSSIVMDDDGTIVDDDDVLSALNQNTLLMALGDNDRWIPVNTSSTSEVEESKEKDTLKRKAETTTDGCMRLRVQGGQLKLGKPSQEELIQSAVTKANSSASGLKAMAKIYGKTGNKLSLYQKSVNNAAVEIAKDQPELVLDKGPRPVKKRKIDAEERAREMKLLQENLETLTNRLRFKQQLLEKAKSLKNFKQCDDISGQIVEVRRERATTEIQLGVLQKREAKSVWYHKGKNTTKKESPRVKKEPTATLERYSCTASTSSTASTVILSGEEEDNSVEEGTPTLTTLKKCSSTTSATGTVILSGEKEDNSVDHDKTGNEDAGEDF
ncbi:hypothetical protein OS493_020811 [Desmophyllum pertusum]|uniref:CIDE-N domain-containing protein n=1 Tax=Desmophyllum pertusum TaxID=174260 RepID=A0A9W9YBI4_9CNID|nr:hypothetical protein OS493_020811 [Desmophyllum pertusum]